MQSSISQALRALAIAILLGFTAAAVPAGVRAQEVGQPTEQDFRTDDDDGTDWGWLGLLGLAGLLGLRRRDRVDRVDTTPRRPVP